MRLRVDALKEAQRESPELIFLSLISFYLRSGFN